MDKLLIRGGRRLQGEIAIAGAKNAALPELCAALLVGGPLTLANVPKLQDIATMSKLLRHMGVAVERIEAAPTTMMLDATRVERAEAPYELVKTMRASILVLGPLLARLGQARVSLPGGCACSTSTPWTTIRLVPAPSICAPMAIRQLARSTISGSSAQLSSTVVPRASAAAISTFSVPVTVTMSKL